MAVMLYAIFREAQVAGNIDYLATVLAVDEDAAEAWADDRFDCGEGERFIIEEEDDEDVLSRFGLNSPLAQSPDNKEP